MAKYVNPGEMNTRIVIEHHDKVYDDAGYFEGDGENWKNVFDGKSVYCKWVNAHGTDFMDVQRLHLKKLATLTLRYSPKIDETCRVFKVGEKEPYEIISFDDVENRHMWLEMKVAQKAEAV